MSEQSKRAKEAMDRLKARPGAAERVAKIREETRHMDESAVWLVWEGTDLRGIYANTEAGRAAAERERARIQGEYDEMDREAGREPQRRPFVEVRRTIVRTGEEPGDE